jgi:hypothetical protein
MIPSSFDRNWLHLIRLDDHVGRCPSNYFLQNLFPLSNLDFLKENMQQAKISNYVLYLLFLPTKKH